jgi:hypothetical protein
MIIIVNAVEPPEETNGQMTPLRRPDVTASMDAGERL